jgi:glucokinase
MWLQHQLKRSTSHVRHVLAATSKRRKARPVSAHNRAIPAHRTDPSADLALAIDVGGTKIAVGLLDHTGYSLAEKTVPTATAATHPDETWAPLAQLIEDLLLLAGDRLVGVGIGSAGPIDVPANTVSPINIPGWLRFPLVERVARIVVETTGHTGLPVRLGSDGVCAAAGEHWRGAAQGVDDVITIVVSTGVGGGLIQGGRLLAGRTGNAGHIGHLVVDLHGDSCPCGGVGCVESIASGTAIVAWARRQGWRTEDVATTAHQLAQDAKHDHPIAVEAFRRAGQALAAGIASAAAIADLSCAVIGGGVANSPNVLFPPIQHALNTYAQLTFLRDLQIRPAQLGAKAGLVGAAALILQPDRYCVPGVIQSVT